MTTKITPEEMELYRNIPEYSGITMTSSNEHMEYAAMFIEKMRKFHRDNDIWIRHTCECNDDGITCWKFVYKTCEVEEYNITEYLFSEWDKIYNPIGFVRDTWNYAPSGLQGCMCPFSMK